MGNKASKGTAPAEQPTPTMGPKEPKPETDSTPTQSVVPRSIEIDQTVPSIPPSKAEEEKVCERPKETKTKTENTPGRN